MTYQQEVQHGLTELRRGVTTLAVMLHLRAENHGYALRLVLSNLGLPLKEGTLYPLLRRLETQGILSGRWDCSGDRMRKYYSLTDFGNEMLKGMQEQWGRLICVVDTISATTDSTGKASSIAGGSYEPV